MAESTQQTTKPARVEVPQYELATKAYIGERLCEEGEVIYYKKPPEWYMKPVNAAAEAMKKKYPSDYRDPIQSLNVVGPTREPQA